MKTYPLTPASDHRVLASKWAVWITNGWQDKPYMRLGYCLKRKGPLLLLTGKQSVHVHNAWIVDRRNHLSRYWPRSNEGYRPLPLPEGLECLKQAGITGTEQLETKKGQVK